ncbi:MAPEG family protein [Thalassotalea sp. LPB0316]|uniref:MAPEG family protein n=1 Tax=Thalassotalea sp. LPB0316 TaxID=2769490 RepID=UPI0018676684|nr:MAPEG family protein [Thalassotalea sp. LPB0316]QOL25691.1 MAPEG family protein [Thalassotalea sp. LPB0316]
MTILIWCLIISALLPMVAKAPVAFAQHKAGGYNNKHPRAQQATLEGFGARALAAHQNAYESLTYIVPALLLAMITNNTGATFEQLAIVIVVARILFNVLYLANLDILRSLTWAVGIGCSIAMMVMCLPA